MSRDFSVVAHILALLFLLLHTSISNYRVLKFFLMQVYELIRSNKITVRKSAYHFFTFEKITNMWPKEITRCREVGGKHRCTGRAIIKRTHITKACDC